MTQKISKFLLLFFLAIVFISADKAMAMMCPDDDGIIDYCPMIVGGTRCSQLNTPDSCGAGGSEVSPLIPADSYFDCGTCSVQPKTQNWTIAPSFMVDPGTGNIGIGSTTPSEKLVVDGAIVIGNTPSNPPVPGTIIWDGTNFKGYGTSSWLYLSDQIPTTRLIETKLNSGLSGGGDLSADRAITLDINNLPEQTSWIDEPYLPMSATTSAGTGNFRFSRSAFLQGITSALTYRGVWDAGLNQPSLNSGNGTNGDMYIVATSGSQNLNGTGLIDFSRGDTLYKSASGWQRVAAVSAVTSFNSRTGPVVPALGDYDASLITSATTSIINAQNVQGAINELSAALVATGNQVGNGLAGYFPYYAANGNILTATSTLFIKPDGSIGIGTTNPGFPLDIANDKSGTTALMRINDTSPAGLWTGYRVDRNSFEKWFFGMSDVTTANDFIIRRNSGTNDNGNNIFTINNSSGFVGIGATSTAPDHALTVFGDMRLTGRLYDTTNTAPVGYLLQATADGIQWVSTSSLGIGGGVSASGTIGQVAYFSGANQLTGTSSIFIAQNGNVGFGTLNPVYKMDVHVGTGNHSDFFITGDSVGSTGIINSNTYNGTSTWYTAVNSNITNGHAPAQSFFISSYDLNSNSASQAKFTIATSGNTGIGTGSVMPDEKLVVSGAIKLSSSTYPASSTPGTIAWNGTNFVGRNNNTWVDLDSQGGGGGCTAGVYFGTSTPTTGNTGGYAGSDALCPTGSHVCSEAEVYKTLSCNISIPTSSPSYWLNGGLSAAGSVVVTDCAGWTSAASSMLSKTWKVAKNKEQFVQCNTALPFLCCK